MPVRQQQESADDQEAQGDGQHLAPGEKSDGVTNEPDEREGANAAERVGTQGALVLLAFQSDQEGQEENEDDLDGIGWQPAVEIHSRLRLLGRTSLAQYWPGA